MGRFDGMADEPQPDEPSLWEEAALHAPDPYTPPHAEPEGLSPLPEDFPVADPFNRAPNVQRIIDMMAVHAVCKTKDCELDDRDTLAEGVAAAAVEAVGALQSLAAVLYAHGEVLVAEMMVESLADLSYNVLRPFFESAGLTVEE